MLINLTYWCFIWQSNYLHTDSYSCKIFMSHQVSFVKKRKILQLLLENGHKSLLFKNSVENSIHTGGNNGSFIAIIQKCRPILHWLLTESNLSAYKSIQKGYIITSFTFTSTYNIFIILDSDACIILWFFFYYEKRFPIFLLSFQQYRTQSSMVLHMKLGWS